MLPKQADFFAQDRYGSTLEIDVDHRLKDDAKTVVFDLKITLSDNGSSRHQTVRLNSMEFVALVAMLQAKHDKACHQAFGAWLAADSQPSQFGHVLDEPVDTPAGSTAESDVIGKLAAVELATRGECDMNLKRSPCPRCSEELLLVKGVGQFDDAHKVGDDEWALYPHLCPGQAVPISPDALDDLADKVLSIFEAEDATRVTATGTAVGDDGPMLDGEVA